MPDLGHSSLLVQDDSGAQEDVYCSFWPEMDSMVRRVISLWKNRQVRLPASYAEESDPEAGFMQRPADHIVHLNGLREDRIRRGWNQLKDSEFDVISWNCSNVSECLLIAAMDRERYLSVQDAVECRLDELDKDRMDSDEMGGVLKYLAESKLIGCHPEDVHRLAAAYQAAFCPALQETDPGTSAKFPVEAGGAAPKREP
jgi:hypothetical protein